VVGIGFLLMSRINSLWLFYLAFLVIGTGFSFGSFVTINTAISNWFFRKRSRAITIAYLGFGASGLLVPLVAVLIDQFGWRESLIILGIVLWLVGFPLGLMMRDKPDRYGYLPDGDTTQVKEESADILRQSDTMKTEPDSVAPSNTVKEALRTRAFWLLSMAWLFQHIGTSAVFIHIVPFLESVQFPTTTAAAVVTGMTICSIIGRLAFGLWGDFANKRYLIAAAISLQTLGLFIFSLIDFDQSWLVFLFLFTYAPGYGGPIPLRPAIQADYFGVRSYGKIMGIMSAISMIGGLASPVVAGWIFDITGSYSLAWQIFTLITLPAIFLILLAKPPKAKWEP
jgi:MFS family permease